MKLLKFKVALGRQERIQHFIGCDVNSEFPHQLGNRRPNGEEPWDVFITLHAEGALQHLLRALECQPYLEKIHSNSFVLRLALIKSYNSSSRY